MAIWPECQHPAVVIARRLGDDLQDSLRTGIDQIWICAHVVLGDDARTVAGARVVDVEEPVGGVVGVKCQSDETALATGQHLG